VQLRHCAMSRKVTGLIPGRVIEIFCLLNLSGHIMALRSIQLLQEMGTRTPPGAEGSQNRWLRNLPPVGAICLEIQGPGASCTCKVLSRDTN
jgi:hypothetical protein